MLNYKQLRQIQDGHRRNADVLELLREIKRLRELAAQAYAALGYSNLSGLSVDERTLIMDLVEMLMREPAVLEYRTRRQNEENLAYRRAQHQARGADQGHAPHKI